MTEPHTVGVDRDLLLGIPAITAFIRDDLGLPVSERQVSFMLENKRIPAGRLGRRVIGSRGAIREELTRAACGDQEA
jgi:hypothetical protein